MCREQSSPLQLSQRSPALADIQTATNSSIDIGGPEDIPGVGLRLHRLTSPGQPDQTRQMPATGRSIVAADCTSHSGIANVPGHASRGDQDQPEPAEQLPAKQQSAADCQRHLCRTSIDNPEHVSTSTEGPEHASKVTEEQPEPLKQVHASQEDATDAQRNSESTGMRDPGHVSTGREDPGEHDCKDTQDTQLEGEVAREAQAELKLSLQLSPEDQDMACGQEEAASEQDIPSRQQPAGEGHCMVSPHEPGIAAC